MIISLWVSVDEHHVLYAPFDTNIDLNAERTFLAWLRTSLAFASIGVAVTQLFRLNTSLQNAEEDVDSSSLSMFELLISSAEPQQKLRHVGKPLGATFLGICKF